MTKGQSPAAQAERLDRGCCPVHGLYMSQIDGWYYTEDGRHVTIVDCPRGDCEDRWLATSAKGMPDPIILERYTDDMKLYDEWTWSQKEIARLKARVAELEARLGEDHNG